MHPSEYINVARQEGSHWWYTGMASAAAGLLRCIPLPDAARILDAGCGTGGGMKWLARFGRALGVDIHAPALRIAADTDAGPVARADVRRLPFADEAFDLLTSFEVLCQLPPGDDAPALREFARVLRPGGWLLLRLPAHDWLRSAHDRFVHTQHRYTRSEVDAKLRAAGIRPVRVTYANCLLFAPALLWRLARRHRTAATDVRAPSAPLNVALSWLLRFEGAWLKRFRLPFGLSVLALAQKNPT